MSKEHLWPQWMGKGADVEPTQSTRTLGFSRTGENELTESPTVVVTKRGSVLTSKAREVCQSCNGGWMSRLETAVKPLLRRLSATSYPLGVTTLSVDEAAIVALWSTKTSWVRELLDPGLRTPSPDMRRYAMDYQLPPSFTRVWVARYTGESNFGATLAHLRVGHQDEGWDSEAHRNVLMVLLTFGGLAILTRTDSDWGVPGIALPDSIWKPIWPASAVLTWPPPRAASNYDLQSAISRYDWVRFPADAVFLRNTDGEMHIRRN
jgi:hypothetical protein